jgi:hypothetical protein
MPLVESGPPVRKGWAARNAVVSLRRAKNGSGGGGAAGRSFAITRPRSVTCSSPKTEASRTHFPVAECSSRIVMTFM